jgi:Ca2+-transporting ATPase
VCADARIITTKNFSTSESSLTGESYSIPKNLDILNEKADLGDRKNMVWSGTFVASGSAKAIVVNTGDFTVIGSIATSVQNITNESEFTKKIGTLGKQISLLALFFYCWDSNWQGLARKSSFCYQFFGFWYSRGFTCNFDFGTSHWSQ